MIVPSTQVCFPKLPLGIHDNEIFAKTEAFATPFFFCAEIAPSIGSVSSKYPQNRPSSHRTFPLGRNLELRSSAAAARNEPGDSFYDPIINVAASLASGFRALSARRILPNVSINSPLAKLATTYPVLDVYLSFSQHKQRQMNTNELPIRLDPQSNSGFSSRMDILSVRKSLVTGIQCSGPRKTDKMSVLLQFPPPADLGWIWDQIRKRKTVLFRGSLRLHSSAPAARNKPGDSLYDFYFLSRYPLK